MNNTGLHHEPSLELIIARIILCVSGAHGPGLAQTANISDLRQPRSAPPRPSGKGNKNTTYSTSDKKYPLFCSFYLTWMTLECCNKREKDIRAVTRVSFRFRSRGADRSNL